MARRRKDPVEVESIGTVHSGSDTAKTVWRWKGQRVEFPVPVRMPPLGVEIAQLKKS